MKFRIVVCVWALILALMYRPAWPEGLVFGILSKSMDDRNFIDMADGCLDAAALNGDVCVHIGGEGSAGPMAQVLALKDSIRSNVFDAYAISVVKSDLLAKTVREYVNVPVMTFDSPFAADDSALSFAYVGTDNVAFGRDLAKIVERFRPQGGTVFLMSALHDTNLSQRVWGVRLELSGQPSFPQGQRLNGENGWYEPIRSPWNSGDKVERALGQVQITLKRLKPDVIISVGQWPIVDPDAYRKAVQSFYLDITSKKRLMVFGVGNVIPEYRDMVEEGLIHGLVSIDFPEIGRQTYAILSDIIDKKPVPKETFIPNTIIVAGQ